MQGAVECRFAESPGGALSDTRSGQLERIDLDVVEAAERAEGTVIRLDRAPQSVQVTRASAGRRAAKRALDVALSSVMLILSLPVFLVIALLIKLDDRGPVFYRQERWGFLGRHFRVLKFRTMVPDAGIRQATEDDDRVTRVGGVLRKTGLDELPQLVNIWRGDMSFVGPRALAVDEILLGDPQGFRAYEHVPGFWERMAVRPGLTGVATIYLPKDASPELKFEQDVDYVARQSIWMDLRLIVVSFWISFRGKWETRATKL
jgi:lipopolysaccharide/colanic/teichoic acid biosynthesis glycosyltransferase